jgi:hypothetical protein
MPLISNAKNAAKKVLWKKVGDIPLVLMGFYLIILMFIISATNWMLAKVSSSVSVPDLSKLRLPSSTSSFYDAPQDA